MPLNPDMFTNLYKPDVLSCLADLSNDEVFTPPDLVNKVLDMLPQELFRDPNTTFLDPAVKSGVFLREIAKRLIAGLADKIPNLQERCDWIFQHQLYGIAMTELTSLLSRRSLYCSKYPNSPFSISKFDNIEGNIKYHKIKHTWDKENENGKCIFCGIGYSNVLNDVKREGMENHAYEFIHTLHPEEIFNMKFDVIISNPPYQLETGGGTEEKKSATQAKPIYHKFIEQAKKLRPRYISMIIPARWYNGGMGLNQFRNDMLNDKSLVRLVDYNNSKDCFQGVDIAGGICYFLWDRDHPSEQCTITNITGDGVSTRERPLSEFGSFFIRANDSIPIIKKVLAKTTNFMSESVSAIDTFGIPSKEKGHKDYRVGDVKLLHTVGYNDQGNSYIEKNKVKKNQDLIDKYKVKISIMVPQGGEVGIKPENGYRSISTPQIVPPGMVDTFSYLNIGFFDTEEEAKNLISFISTKFARYLLRTTYSSVHVSKDNFCFVPKMDMHKKWNDKELFDYFGLNDEERKLIDKTMRPMEL